MPPSIKYQEVERARREFGKIMTQYLNQGGDYLDPAPMLETAHVANCKIIVDRHAIIDLMKKGGVVAEIGIDKGEFSKHILESSTPSEFHMFDIDLERLSVLNVQAGLEQGVCKLHGGDSSELLGKFDDGFFDWIYIDGDHRYEGVMKDIQVAAKKVKPDGRLVLNDYTVWSPQTMMHCGVARAVNEFCLAEGWELEYFSFQSLMYNDVVIKKS